MAVRSLNSSFFGGHGPESAALLRACHRNAFALCAEHELARVAFPAISCGVYGYPVKLAAPLALECVTLAPKNVAEVTFVLFDAEAWRAWTAAATLRFGARDPV